MAEGNRDDHIITGRFDSSNPCLLALKSMGYQLTMVFHRLPDDKLLLKFEADKDGCHFSALGEEELLGLVAMRELRGENWQTQPGELYLYEVLYSDSVIRELDGQVVEYPLRWM